MHEKGRQFTIPLTPCLANIEALPIVRIASPWKLLGISLSPSFRTSRMDGSRRPFKNGRASLKKILSDLLRIRFLMDAFTQDHILPSLTLKFQPCIVME